MIKIGDRLPSATVYEMTDSGPQPLDVGRLVQRRKVVLFGLPGAFTPTCSARHVPGFLEQYAQLKSKGIDEILCVSVNDAYVMRAWAQSQGTEDRIRMLADGNGELTEALGLAADRRASGMGRRSQRYSLYAEDGVVRLLNIEQPGKFEVSDAGTLLIQLDRLGGGRDA